MLLQLSIENKSRGLYLQNEYEYNLHLSPVAAHKGGLWIILRSINPSTLSTRSTLLDKYAFSEIAYDFFMTRELENNLKFIPPIIIL